jgi:putative transcriptional regulator
MKKRSRILTEVQETAAALYHSGSIDKQTMRQFDALSLPQVRDLTPKQIRVLRARARMSQAVFAAFLNTSVSTVQKWEIGEKKPSGPSLKLLNLIDKKGLDALV